MAFVTVYDNLSGTVMNGAAGFQKSVSLTDEMYAKWAEHRDDNYVAHDYRFCLGPGCKCDYTSGNGLLVEAYSYTGGWIKIDYMRASYGPAHTGWPFGPAHEPYYTEGGDISRRTNSTWLFEQTVTFRIRNELFPPLSGPFGVITPGPDRLSFSGLTFTIGDQCPGPPPPPPPVQTYAMHGRGIALPFGYVGFWSPDPFGVEATSGGGSSKAIVI